MKLIELVKAYLAADEMSRLTLPYDLALAVVRVKRATRDDAELFLQKEQELVRKYAAMDADGNVKMATSTSFAFRDLRDGPKFNAERRELEETDLGEREQERYKVKAPAEIKPEYIEALEGFIEFQEAET